MWVFPLCKDNNIVHYKVTDVTTMEETPTELEQHLNGGMGITWVPDIKGRAGGQ